MKKEELLKTRPVQIDEVTWESLKYAKQRTHKPIKELIAEFAKNLIQVMATSDLKDCNLEYEVSMFPERTLKVRVMGQSSFVICQMSPEEFHKQERERARERRGMFEETKLSIAEINQKQVNVKE